MYAADKFLIISRSAQRPARLSPAAPGHAQDDASQPASLGVGIDGATRASVACAALLGLPRCAIGGVAGLA